MSRSFFSRLLKRRTATVEPDQSSEPTAARKDTVDDVYIRLGRYHAQLMMDAMAEDNILVLKYLIDKFKDDKPDPPWRMDYVVLMEATMRLEHFKLFFDVDPIISEWRCGHCGNVPGIAIMHRNIPVLDLLLKKGADPDDIYIWCRSGMSYAVGQGDLEIVSMLLDHGAHVKGTNALSIAQKADKFDMLELLVEKGGMDINVAQHKDAHSCDPNLSDEDGEIAASASPVLHLAIDKGQTELVRALLQDLDADPTVKDGRGRTALQRAQKNGNRTMVKLLTEKTALLEKM